MTGGKGTVTDDIVADCSADLLLANLLSAPGVFGDKLAKC